jgi:hypothetical protein
MCDKLFIFLFPFAFIRFYSVLRSRPQIDTNEQDQEQEAPDGGQRADPREGPFGRYGFCASHTGIYLSDAEQRCEDFFM